MNHLQKLFPASLIALVALFSASSMAMATPATSLSNFAILSAAPIDKGTYSSTGAVSLGNTLVNGDVGSSGLAASVVQTGSTVITGAIIAPVDASVVTAFNTALANGLALTCKNVAADGTGNAIPPYTGTLANVTLTPGVYCIDAEAKTGTLTLNGAGTYTFIVAANAPTNGDTTPGTATGALTGTNFNVVLTNGAVPCDVTWYVAQAATLTDSNFVGTIYAGAAITITRGTFNGDALAGAAVTTTATTVNGCTSTRQHSHVACNQGVGNGPDGCDPGNSNQSNRYPNTANPFLRSNDEPSLTTSGGMPGTPGRKGGNK
jgi:hypothetical protein